MPWAYAGAGVNCPVPQIFEERGVEALRSWGEQVQIRNYFGFEPAGQLCKLYRFDAHCGSSADGKSGIITYLAGWGSYSKNGLSGGVFAVYANIRSNFDFEPRIFQSLGDGKSVTITDLSQPAISGIMPVLNVCQIGKESSATDGKSEMISVLSQPAKSIKMIDLPRIYGSSTDGKSGIIRNLSQPAKSVNLTDLPRRCYRVV